MTMEIFPGPNLPTANGSAELLFVTDPRFGAQWNGTTDDTAAVTAADIYAASIGAALYFPGGTGIVSSKVTPSTNAHWIGQGSSLTIISTNSATATVVDMANDNVSLEGFEVRAAVTRNSGSVGIRLAGLNVKLTNCNSVLHGVGVLGARGFWGAISPIFSLHQVNCRLNTDYDMRFDACFIGSLDDCLLTGNTTAPSANLYLVNCDQMQILNCSFLGGDSGILAGPGDGQFVSNVRGIQSYVDSCQTRGIFLSPGGTGFVEYFDWSNGWISSAANSNFVAQGNGSNISHVMLNNNTMRGRPGTTVGGITAFQVNDLKITGNDLQFYTGAAVNLDGCNIAKILNNTVYGNTGIGVQMLNATDYCRVDNNYLKGATTPLSDTSTGTHNTIGSNDV